MFATKTPWSGAVDSQFLLLLVLLLPLLLLLLNSTRLDIRIKSQKHDCNGKAEPKEPLLLLLRLLSRGEARSGEAR